MTNTYCFFLCYAGISAYFQQETVGARRVLGHHNVELFLYFKLYFFLQNSVHCNNSARVPGKFCLQWEKTDHNKYISQNLHVMSIRKISILLKSKQLYSKPLDCSFSTIQSSFVSFLPPPSPQSKNPEGKQRRIFSFWIKTKLGK